MRGLAAVSDAPLPEEASLAADLSASVDVPLSPSSDLPWSASADLPLSPSADVFVSLREVEPPLLLEEEEEEELSPAARDEEEELLSLEADDPGSVSRLVVLGGEIELDEDDELELEDLSLLLGSSAMRPAPVLLLHSNRVPCDVSRGENR